MFSSRERLMAIALVNQLSSYVGACERLLQTPVPLNYARHTSRFLTLWCFTLPVSLVGSMGFGVIPVTAFVTWCLFGIQEIGLFIEHCALDNGDVFMDSIADQVMLDVVEAIREDDGGEDTFWANHDANALLPLSSVNKHVSPDGISDGDDMGDTGSRDVSTLKGGLAKEAVEVADMSFRCNAGDQDACESLSQKRRPRVRG